MSIEAELYELARQWLDEQNTPWDRSGWHTGNGFVKAAEKALARAAEDTGVKP